jgi:chromosome segregation ATPase
MYVDLPKANSTELARVRIGDIIVKNSVRDAEPPFCEDAFYYFITENALLRWGIQEDGTKGWKQINSVSDVTADLSDVKSKVAIIEGNIDQLEADLAAEVKRSGDVDTDHEARIAAIESDYATGSAVSTTVNEINEKIGKTNEAVAAAQSKADSAYGLAEEAKADAETAQGAAETAQGAAEAAQGAADNAQSTADSALAAAGAAQGTADSALANAGNAQSKADEAYNLAE